ncbi:MAG: RNase adapter RapZ [Actinobacteria bacterium]|nr:RNase adapter RapZ [Actinomycetota bacterium]
MSLHVTIITGLSGAGKSLAVNTFEDAGYFCVDNMPPQMLPGMTDVFCLPGAKTGKVALVFDIRGREFFTEFDQAMEELDKRNIPHRIVFLEADEETLVARYQATRRTHPLDDSGSIVEGIRREQRLLASLRERADVVIDTSDLNVHELRRRIQDAVLAGELINRVLLSYVSFGYKYGLPTEADLVLDARFLPNPHWVESLRPLTGQDAPVSEYVLNRPEALGFLERISSLLKYLVPLYLQEGKTHVIVAVGCTGGRHRSVALTETLAGLMDMEPTVDVSIRHRDLGRQS